MNSSGRFANDEFRLEPDFVLKGGIGILNPFDEEFGGGGSHLVEGLPDGGEPRAEVFRDDNVVESYDGDVTRAVEADIFDCADGADGGCVVEGEDRRKVTSP